MKSETIPSFVSAGMTKNEALFAQFSTAIAAYCRTFVGLFGMQTVKDFIGNDLMVPFTTGRFVYLTAMTILPDLSEQRLGRWARLAKVIAFFWWESPSFTVSLFWNMLEEVAVMVMHMDMDMDMGTIINIMSMDMSMCVFLIWAVTITMSMNFTHITMFIYTSTRRLKTTTVIIMMNEHNGHHSHGHAHEDRDRHHHDDEDDHH